MYMLIIYYHRIKYAMLYCCAFRAAMCHELGNLES